MPPLNERISDITARVGKRVREARKSMLLTQEELAEKIDVSPGFLAMIEVGKRIPSVMTLTKLCRALGISADIIMPEEAKRPAAAISKKTSDRLTSAAAEAMKRLSPSDRKLALKFIKKISR